MKKILSLLLILFLVTSCFPTGAFAADCTDSPVITVTRENERANTLLVTSACSHDTYYDVSYKFSKKSNDNYSNLTNTVSNANSAAILLPTDFGNYYLYCSSSNGEQKTTQKFGPFNVGNNGFIEITSSLPDANKSYESFEVSYSLSSPYTGNTINLENSSYCWTTSPTSNAGNEQKFTGTVGTIASPVGVKGTYYLHMSVVDSGGYRSYDVVGPVNLTGTTATVYFSGIQPNVNKQQITINIGIPATQVDFGSSGYQVVAVGASEGTYWKALSGSATVVSVSEAGSYQIIVKLKTTDGLTNRYQSEIFSVGKGGSTSGTAKVTYSPDSWTSDSVKATIVVTDSYGNRVEPVTSGIVRKSDTTYEYTVSKNGSYVLEWVNTSGGIISTTLQVNWIDTEGPTIKVSNNDDEIKVTLADSKSGISKDSYLAVGDDEESLPKTSNKIILDDYYYGYVQVVAKDNAGNITKELYTVDHLPNNWDVDISYDKVNSKKWEANIEIDDDKNVGYEITNKSGYIKNSDGSYSVYFDSNGSKELKIKTNDKKTFTILLRMDRLEDQLLEIEWDYKKLDRIGLSLDYDEDKVSIDYEESYYRLIGEKKQYFEEGEDDYTIRIKEDGEYQIECVIYTADGDREKYTSNIIILGGDNEGVYDKDAYEDGEYQNLSNNKNNTNTGNTSNPNNTVVGTGNLSFKTQHTAYVNGYGKGYYGLSRYVTRAEFYSMLDRITTGGNSTNNFTLNDVRSSDWFYGTVMRFVNMGVVYLPSNTFNPNGAISRAEVAYTLNRLGTNKVAYTAAQFSDIKGHWAEQDIIEANRKGLVAGYTDGTFKPGNSITRAECIAMLNRASNRTCASKGTNVGNILPSSAEISTTNWAYKDVVEAINSH